MSQISDPWDDPFFQALGSAIQALCLNPNVLYEKEAEWSDGLNATELNRLAAECGLGGGIVIEWDPPVNPVRDENPMVFERSLVFHHPDGRIPKLRILYWALQGIVNHDSDAPKLVQKRLKAWQEARKHQIESSGAAATGESRSTPALPGDELSLAEASREFGVPSWALTRASQKPKDKPGHLPTRRVGRSVMVERDHAKSFAENYDARREQRVVGSKSEDGRKIVANLKNLKKTAPPKKHRKSN